MRVESSKANQNNKPNQTVDKSESVFRSTANNSQIAVSTPPAAATTTGAFEKIMKEARQQSGKDEKTSAKSESRAENSESSDVKKSEGKDVKGKDELKERDQNKNGGDKGEGGGEENENAAMLASLGIFSNGKSSGETSVPAARSILHVADLERIVSTLRTIETRNSQQVLISLKNSVLEGLQIKLTIDENGKLKAEFIALNEKIREQLKARKNELSEIFKNRGVKFQEFDIRTFSELESERKNSEEEKNAAGNII